MRLLVVHSHPVPESFNTALCRAVVDTARDRGQEVRLLDLYAEGFDPVMSVEERRTLHDDAPPIRLWPPISRISIGPRG